MSEDMNHCADCKHFDGPWKQSELLFGECMRIDTSSLDPKDSLAYILDYEGGTTFLVRPDFGCEMHEAK